MPRTATRREEDDDEVQVFLREPLAQLSQESSFICVLTDALSSIYKAAKF